MAEREMYDFERDFLTKFPYRLSRKFEENLPEFSNHLEARIYFKERFGDDFFLTDSEVIDGDKIYFYELVVHRENYDKLQKELRENGYSSGTEGLMSSHKVEIWEDGRVHIVY